MTTPRPFQVEDVARLKRFGLRGLDASEMGLGKTLKALLCVDWHLRKGPVVAVCPKTIKPNWRNECKTHVGIEATILHSRQCPPDPARAGRGAFYVVNYDILGYPDEPDHNPGRSWWRWLKDCDPQMVIIDEIQNVKNEVSTRFRCLANLCRGVPHVIGLGGTAGLENNVAELWAPLSLIKPGLFPSKLAFCDRYSNSYMEYGKWVHRGVKNAPELNKILLDTVMVRRRKADVLKDLPAKSRYVQLVGLDRPKEYKAAVLDFRRKLLSGFGGDKAREEIAKRTHFNQIRQLVGELKYAACLEWIQTFTAENSPKLLVGGVNVAVLERFHKAFPDSVLVNGGVTGKARQDAIERFNSDPRCGPFFGNLKAAGEGWSCTSADDVAFVQMGLKPSEHTQFEDRVNGLGRGTKGGKTRVFYLLAADTVEERQCELIEAKQRTLSAVLDGGPVGGDFDVFDLLCDHISRAKP